MLDAWLPGLLACLGPRVFALSGGIRKQDGAAKPLETWTPVLLHPGQGRTLPAEGFTLNCCRKGPLGSEVSVHDWLRLLLSQ